MSEVTFSLKAPEAREVYVTGDFNGWKLDDNSRMNLKNGSWNKRLNLTKGKYHYRFVIDGKWVEDPNNPVQEINPFGELNSALII